MNQLECQHTLAKNYALQLEEECWRVVHVNNIQANLLMIVSSVMFGRVVAQVLLSRLMIELKESLCFTIKEPEIPHFHSL
jgi:hypothetical protein